MNLTFTHITATIGRFKRSVIAVLGALLCVVGSGRNLQPVRSAGASMRSPVRRSLPMNSLHRLGRVLIASSCLLATTTFSHAYDINNIATVDFTYSGSNYTMNSNAATVTVTPTPSVATIELFHYTPDLAGTTIPQTDFSTTAAPGTFGALTPVPAPGILTPSTAFNEGEVVIIQVSDSDQNLDPALIDNITVDVSDSGDIELLLLRETAPDSGIFLGYLYTGTNSIATYDGYLTAIAGSSLAIAYDDGGTPTSLSAPVIAAPTNGSGLWLQLSTDKTLVTTSDIFSYELTVENIDSILASTATVTQQLPTGFRYQQGSTHIDGTAAPEPIMSTDGSSLIFNVGDIPVAAITTINFRVMVGAVYPGEYPSGALAQAASGQVSNPADTTVRVRDELGNGKSVIAGRVLNGCGNDAGVADVRIYLEDGTFVLTDKRGRYHVEGVNPGSHVLQIDPITFPEGYNAVLCEDHNRFAGNPESRFIDLEPGTLWRADFYISEKPINGEVSISLVNNYEIGSAATYTATLTGKDIPFRNQKLEIDLPPEATYLPGSSLLNGSSIPDPEITGQSITYLLPDQDGAEWQQDLTLRAFINQESMTKEMLAHARLGFDTPTNLGLVTPDAESTLIWISRGERANIKELLLRPHFGTMDAVLTQDDIKAVDSAVEQIKDLNIIKIFVVGHTDARRIRWSEGILYRDNFELSEARAEAVSRQLQQELELDPSQLVIVGMGAAEPMADNETVEGMALNRRTELRVLHRVVVDPENEKIAAQSSQVEFLKTAMESNQTKNGPESVDTGILSPIAGRNLPHNIEPIRIRLDSRLQPKLTLDGQEISNERIGFKMQEPETDTTIMTYIGTDFGDPGPHILKIEGVGPFGNTRFEDEITVNRTGKIARLEIVDTKGNIADGRTPVRIKVAMYDESGLLIPAGSKLEVRGGNLAPVNVEKARLPDAPESNLLNVSNNGLAAFEPVSQSGRHHIVLGFEDIEVEADIYISPEKRDWILVSLGVGTAGYNEISGNIHPLDPNKPEEDYYDEGRIAFFAKGQIKGDWLLTMAYDSDKEDLKDRSLHQVIDPGSYYTVYGDTSEQGYEAASAEKLFIRIERERFYTVFGDINTGLNVTELSRYNRSLTGIKSEYSGRNFGYTAFASETAQNFIRDEIQGDGTSGLYRLSQNDIVINSEKVVLETRDRFHSEQIVTTSTLQRHLDYDIDYAAGTIFFKEPVLSRDQDLNPIFIAVDYETGAQGAEDYTYGGRAYGRLQNGDIEIGASLVHEGQNSVESDLVGFDVKLKLTDSLTLNGEWATTETTTPLLDTEGDAWLAEIEHRSQRFDLTVYMREQEPGFGLGQQNASESGTRKFGTDLRYRVSQKIDVDAEFYQQENLATDIKRMVEEATVNYHDKHYSLSAGLRHAEDEQTTGTTETSDQITFGANYHVTEKLDLTLRHEQSISNNENRDYPTRTAVGANYKLNRSVSLFAEQEITEGDSADTANTRIGLNATPWDGGQIRTSMEQNLSEAGRRIFGNLGLLQTWQINPKLSLNFSVDRSQVLSGLNSSSIHPDQPPTSGSSEDFTALSSGISYRERDWTFDTRVEYRTSDTEDKWGLFAGSIVEPETFLGLSLHGSYFTTERSDQSTTTDADLSFGLAYRPDNRSWIVLNRLDLITSEDEASTTKTSHWKIIERLNAFWRANEQNRLTFKLGTRYAADDFDTVDYSGITYLLGSEWRHDLSERTDIGLHGSILQVQELSQSLYHSGVSVGYSPAKNFWISVGYNYQGFQDDDFSQADYTAQGPYVKFRVKFDQNSIRDALDWLRSN